MGNAMIFVVLFISYLILLLMNLTTEGFKDIKNPRRMLFEGKEQAVAVRGQLQCGNSALGNVRVQLWDDDWLDEDDLLATTRTDEDGYFQINGSIVEFSNIKPKIVVLHQCDHWALCYRRSEIATIPQQYLSNNIETANVYDLKNVDVQPRIGEETIYC